MSDNKKVTFTYFISALLFLTLAVVGTFVDTKVSDALYMPLNLPFMIISVIGQYVFFGSVVFFGGVIFSQVIKIREYSNAKKACVLIICGIIVLIGAYFGARTIPHSEGFGAYDVISNMPHFPVLLASLVITMPPFFICGFRAKITCDKHLIGKLLRLIVFLIFLSVVVQILKGFFERPRYRTTLAFDDVSYVPWYKAVGDAKAIAAKFGTEKNSFESFPSAHSWMAAASLYIIPAFSWVSGKLKGKEFQLTVAGLVIALLVMLSRIVLGAHYLTDVSIGAFAGTVMSFIQLMIESKINHKIKSTDKERLTV